MKRRDVESQIVEFFQTATPDITATMFRIVRGIVATRGLLTHKGSASSSPLPTPRTRRARADGAPLIEVQSRSSD